jgi:hypothetical protein
VITDITTIVVKPQKALTEANMSDIFSKIDYIPLETNDEHLIGEINQILVYKDRLYLMDQYRTESVFCYSTDGKFLYELNGKGRGPGKYIKLENIGIDHDNDRLLISSAHQIVEYDLDGNYIETHHVDLWSNYFTYIGNNCAAFYGDYTANTEYEKENMTPNLFVTKDYKVIHTDIYFPSTTNFGALMGLINNFSNDCSGTVSFLAAYNDTIYHLTSDTVKRAYYIDFDNMKKTESFYALLYGSTATTETIHGNNACHIIAMTETRTCLFFEYMHGNTYHFVFYYKDTGRVIDVCREYKPGIEAFFPIRDDMHNIRFILPLFTDGHSFYGYIDAYEIAERKESVTDPELKKKIANLSADDNPVVVVMTPK